MKYKVGDKARVRRDVVVDEVYGDYSFVDIMRNLIGNIVTINKVLDGCYHIEEHSCYITDEMLEDVEEEFKLPEKWCIRLASKEINDAVNSIKLWPYGNLTWSNRDNYTNHYIGFDGCYAEGLVSGNYIEITFDQFKKYVLKESESIPKFESKFVKGKWYKNPKWWSSPQDFCKFSGEFSGCLIGYTDKIIKGVPYFGSTGYWCNGDLCTEASAEEIQQYLPENHPDKLKKRTKKVEDLKYPDVVHCNSQKERNLLKNHVSKFDINNWTSEDPYLLIGGGCCSHPYEENTFSNYVNYEFSDIIFPEEKVETKHKLSKEELLAEAKRRYPIGTKYKCANGISASGAEECFEIIHGDELRFFDDSKQKIDAIGRGFVYYVGSWAEIISKPTVEQHSKYVECIGLEEVDVMFWNHNFTVGEIYLVEEDDGTTTFRINGMWCDKSQFKPSTKETFDKQGESGIQKKEELVQTGLSQYQACDSCKYNDNCGNKGFFCNASGGQHYPKEYIPGNRTEGYMDGVNIPDRPLIHLGNVITGSNGKYPSCKMFYDPYEVKFPWEASYWGDLIKHAKHALLLPEECKLDSSGDIIVNIKKTEVKQIKL